MKNGLLFLFCLTFFACQKNEVFYPSSVDNYSSFEEFEKDDDSMHYLLVVGEINAPDFIQKVKPDVRKFSEQHFPRKPVRISNIYLGVDQFNRKPLVIVRRFKNKEEVMDFYRKILKRPKRFLPKRIRYQLFPISHHNYRVALKNRSLEGYAEFFEANY